MLMAPPLLATNTHNRKYTNTKPSLFSTPQSPLHSHSPHAHAARLTRAYLRTEQAHANWTMAAHTRRYGEHRHERWRTAAAQATKPLQPAIVYYTSIACSIV